MTGKSAKDFYKLYRNIGKLTNGQARVVTWNDEDLMTFQIEIAPSDGLYANGKFLFEIFQDPDGKVPTVFCSTEVYHPNIDTIEPLCTGDTDSKSTNVCVSLLDDWDDSMDMEDLIQAILFLFYQPDLEDPLCTLVVTSFNDMSDMEEFGENVKRSLMGGEVEGHQFEANFGYIENGLVKIKENDIENIDSEDTKDCFANEVENEIITNIEKLDLKEDKTASTLAENNTICEQEQNMEKLSFQDNGYKKEENFTTTPLKYQNKEFDIGAQENHLNGQPSLVNTPLPNTQQNLKELDFRTRNSVDNSLVRCTFLVASICRHFVRKFVKWKQRL